MWWRKNKKQDQELEDYRAIMSPPEKFEEGFNWKTVVGAVFVGAMMVPATLYLQLVVGAGGHVDQAGRWVTIIIFAEIARRSFKELRMQEVYVLYMMAGMAMSYPFQGFLWNQFFVQSEYVNAVGVAREIPDWWAPSAAQIQADGRTFFTQAWLTPIAMVFVGLIITKVDQFSLSYVNYRLVNDVEELPFPMAPVGAAGMIALIETRDTQHKWRWRCFSIGGVMGFIFGVFYIGIPAVSAAFLAAPVQLIPIPWIDFTQAFAGIRPATPMNLTMDLGAFLAGTVIPFWAVVGGVLGVIITIVLNPILQKEGILTSWTPQMDFVDTTFSNYVDFYLSFGIGLTVAIVVISLGQILKPLLTALRGRSSDGATPHLSFRQGWRRLMTNNTRRGDFSILLALFIYIANSAFWIGLCTWLVPGFPWLFFVFYVVVYNPILAYANAKLEGLCGQAVSIPMVKEAAFILSGYQGARIWFAPTPAPMYGPAIVDFRIMELTGTKLKSMIKTQLLTLPILLISILVFSHVLWGMAEVPSNAFPYAQVMWDLNAKNASLIMTSTMGSGSEFMEAWNFGYFGWGIGSGVLVYMLLSVIGLPTLLVFGLVRGLGESHPGALIFQFVGALVGRFYLRRRFGNEWLKYAPVILAGYSCGIGLIAMVSIAITTLYKMIAPLIY